MMSCNALRYAIVLGISVAPLLAGEPPGKLLYNQHCASCHGPNGDGNGPASVWLFPKPRDFSAGLFKLKSTPAGSLPTDQDLFDTITRGMAGSSMPSFSYLNEKDRSELVQYIKYLTATTDAEGKRINHFEQAKANGNGSAKPIQVPPEPPVTLQAITRGQEMYQKLQCFTCHGETGAGDGPSAPTLKDNWGIPLVPRDFNSGAFRGGPTGKDLYLRIATGMAGTPMPPFPDDLVPPEDRWALVLYIQSLRRKDMEVNDILTPPDGNITAQRVRQIATDPVDPTWERLESFRVPLNPLWPERDPITAVTVRAVHDGRRIALHCSWRDAIVNGAPVRVQDFQDSLAVQFSLSGRMPFLGMGDPDNPVNIWQWKAGWQQDSDGQRQDVDTTYASMHSDTYFGSAPLYHTADSAGNLNATAIRRSPVEDANAKGFGTFQSQSYAGQHVGGKGIWRDGHWSVVVVRDLKTRDKDDVKFSTGTPVPVAFAVWDGENKDRNGRKVISNWYQLHLGK